MIIYINMQVRVSTFRIQNNYIRVIVSVNENSLGKQKYIDRKGNKKRIQQKSLDDTQRSAFTENFKKQPEHIRTEEKRTQQVQTEQNTSEQNTSEQNTSEQNTSEQNTSEQNRTEEKRTQQVQTEQNTSRHIRTE